MKTYWDSSALIDAIIDEGRARETFDAESAKITRCHTFAEAFSYLTGGRAGFRMLPEEAATVLRAFAKKMKVISLDESATFDALDKTHAAGVRGGAIHDFLHASAAKQHGCKKIYTLNLSHFEALSELESSAP